MRRPPRRASKSANCNVFLWTLGRPRNKICKCAGLRDGRSRPPACALPDRVHPAASPRQASGSRSALRCLPPRGPPAICYRKRNSNHTHRPQTRSDGHPGRPPPIPLQCLAPRVSFSSSSSPVCPATRSKGGFALQLGVSQTGSPRLLNPLQLPPTMKKRVIRDIRSTRKDIPQTNAHFCVQRLRGGGDNIPVQPRNDQDNCG